LRPHPESKPPSYHGSRESRRYRQRQKLLGQALRRTRCKRCSQQRKPAFFASTLYKARSRIEQGVGRLKRFKRIALRCEKTARNFTSIVAFAAGLCLIKFVHTA
jgi:transposase